MVGFLFCLDKAFYFRLDVMTYVIIQALEVRMYRDATASGRDLHQRFIALGDMTGKTADEIITALQIQPTSISSMARGMTLLQWQAIGCHMSLLFDANSKFVKISHQYANYTPAPVGCVTLIAILVLFVAFIVFILH